MIEKYNIKFKKEEHYKKYIKGLDCEYRFDFTIYIDDRRYFVEIFGIEGNDKYDKKISKKKQLCKNNNLKLIDLYGDDLLKTTDEIYEMLIEKINKLKEGI